MPPTKGKEESKNQKGNDDGGVGDDDDDDEDDHDDDDNDDGGVDEDHGANHSKKYKDRGELEKAFPGISAFLEEENQKDEATLLDRRRCLVKIMNLNRDKYMLSCFKIRLENESATRLEKINTLTDELDLLKSKLVVAEEKVVKVELKLRTIGAAGIAGKENVVNKELVALCQKEAKDALWTTCKFIQSDEETFLAGRWATKLCDIPREYISTKADKATFVSVYSKTIRKVLLLFVLLCGSLDALGC